ncbi:LysR family transcriptional regulator [Aliamphritea hakodatensis]|uniref:LysR family transcriptional regulator n=1 Tax=Aliamphritea hakodatensis TaxID=2895352 RepID=UPI0022FD8623|nr:LysR substrate-binding domain-containing protein [Aliamphritea hakodatensis]
MMRLDMRHWEMFHQVCQCGTLRQAAQVMGISQSALSHRLAEAERRLGGAVFERQGRVLKLTPAGEVLIQQMQQVLPVLQRAEQDFIQRQQNDGVTLRIGVAAYNCYHWLADFMAVLRRQAPGIEIELIAAATHRPLQSLLESEVDMVLAPGHMTTPGVEAIALFEDCLELIVPVNHPLAVRDSIHPQDLQTENYLTYSRTTQPGFEYERFIRPAGVVPGRLSVVEVTDAIVELIAAGFGVSILSRWAVSEALSRGRVVAVTPGKGLSLQWSALVRRNEKSSSEVRQLAGMLQTWFQANNTPA